MKHLTILVKPTHQCNLRCRYCYNAASNYTNERLSISSFNKIARCVPDSYTHVSFVWLGGEPLLMGLDFYKEAMQIEKGCLKDKFITNNLTTNGTLMSTDFATFFVQNDFHIAFSYDGSCNDIYRMSTQKTLIGISNFSAVSKPRSTVVMKVVQKEDLANPEEVYNHFADRGMNFQLNPIITQIGEQCKCDGYTPKSYAEFLCKIYDQWANDETRSIVVEPIARNLRSVLLGRSTACCHSTCVGKYISVDPKGDLYPCSRFLHIQYRYGNVDSISTFDEAFSSLACKSLKHVQNRRIKECKANCDLFSLCKAGCTFEAISNNTPYDSGFFGCEVNRTFIPYVMARIEEYKLRGTPPNERVRRVLSAIC